MIQIQSRSFDELLTTPSEAQVFYCRARSLKKLDEILKQAAPGRFSHPLQPTNNELPLPVAAIIEFKNPKRFVVWVCREKYIGSAKRIPIKAFLAMARLTQQ